MDNEHVRNMKVVLLLSSVASLLILGGAAYKENFRGEWRGRQSQYRELLIAKASDDRARASATSFKIEHKQLYLPELGSIDRCTTCHLGVENPQMVDAEQPLTTHPGELLAHHPADSFGCTICHQGQGRAVDKEAAHGWHEDGSMVKHTESPLLRGRAVYTSCGTCHYETDLFGGMADLHRGSATGPSDARNKPVIRESDLSRSLAGADIVADGKRLLVSSGCLGCHKYRGRGGVLGPDITYVGDKTKHDFDFSHVDGEHTVEQWLFEHFKFPREVSPDTIMPDMGYTKEQAAQLTGYMMNLHRKSAPASHRPPPIAADRQGGPIHGETLYMMFCSACHGPEGRGTTLRTGLWPTNADPWGHEWDARDIVTEQRSDIDVMVPSLNHPDTLAVASSDYLRHVIAAGRPGTKMIGWSGEGGLSDDEITLLVDYIRNWNPVGPDVNEVASARGDTYVGGALYRANCAACHGVNGEGGIGVTLNSSTFLAVTSDAFLRDTIIHGRPNTAMPAWREFTAQEVSDLLAFIRQWQPIRSTVAEATKMCEGPDNSLASARIGRILFKVNCVMCHGTQGQGDLAPSINTQEFLTVVSDEYLVSTLIEGHPGTAMPSWRHMLNEDIASLVRLIKTWRVSEPKSEAWHAEVVERGDSDSGQRLFAGMCSACHGVDAEGSSGPQLSNPVFLKLTSDRMLKEWISHGKLGTEMRSFRKSGQGIANLSDRQIEDIIAFLRSLELKGEDELNRVAKSPHGRPRKGETLYASYCTGCHGDRGEGFSGPALSNRNFLRYASDGFLMATMALGRHGTEMRPIKKGPQSILSLSSDEVNDLVAFLRSWEYDSPFATADGSSIPHRYVVPWSLAHGKELFASNCAGCHGSEGKGSWAPELNNVGFLAAATDGFLQATIVRGRRGTAMRPFGIGSHGITDLTSNDVDDIVAYIRLWATQTTSPMTIPDEQSIAVNQDKETQRAGGLSPRGRSPGAAFSLVENPRGLKPTARSSSSPIRHGGRSQGD